MAKLIIYDESADNTVFETFELSENNILIGSGADNHLILDAPDIDPSHASLELRDNTWILQDLGGPGGTAVNGKVIDGPHRLYHDDLIELGFVKVKFQDPERSTTREFPREEVVEIEVEQVAATEQEDAPISGRVWFATVAAATIAVIFIIIFLLAVAHFLEVINISDLLPPWLRFG